MSACKTCRFFFPIPETEFDYEPGKGDCVTRKKDEKGKFWTSKPVFETGPACAQYQSGLQEVAPQ